MIRIRVLDGQNVIGGNKILVEGEEGCILLDFGINFASWGNYFEKFISPRTGLIVKDLLKLNLLPEIDMYRSDFTGSLDLPKLSKEIIFAFLSHAHNDHMGLVGLLREDIPILSTTETLALTVALSEINSEENSRLIVDRRTPGTYPVREDVLIKPNQKSNKNPIKRKLIYSGDNGVSSLPLSKDLIENYFEEVDIENSFQAGSVDAEVLPVYHSVIGSASLYFTLSGIRILYTGDLRDSPLPEEERLLQEIGENRLKLANSTREMIDATKGKVDVLIVEGTRTKESHSKITEAILYSNVYEEVKKHRDKLIIADFPFRHLERFHTFLKVAEETDRQFVVLPKDYIILNTLAKINSDWDFRRYLGHIRVYHQGKGSWKGWENRLLQGEIFNDPPIEDILIKPSEIEKSPGSYILNIGYYELPNLLDFSYETLRGAIYIHSNSEAYTEDQNIDFLRLLRWLRYFNIEPKGVREKDGSLEFDRIYHASGHISPEGLEALIEEIDPRIIVPVHTESPGWFYERWGKKVRLNSDIILY
jgi:ribonuclease J